MVFSLLGRSEARAGAGGGGREGASPRAESRASRASSRDPAPSDALQHHGGQSSRRARRGEHAMAEGEEGRARSRHRSANRAGEGGEGEMGRGQEQAERSGQRRGRGRKDDSLDGGEAPARERGRERHLETVENQQELRARRRGRGELREAEGEEETTLHRTRSGRQREAPETSPRQRRRGRTEEAVDAEESPQLSGRRGRKQSGGGGSESTSQQTTQRQRRESRRGGGGREDEADASGSRWRARRGKGRGEEGMGASSERSRGRQRDEEEKEDTTLQNTRRRRQMQAHETSTRQLRRGRTEEAVDDEEPSQLSRRRGKKLSGAEESRSSSQQTTPRQRRESRQGEEGRADEAVSEASQGSIESRDEQRASALTRLRKLTVIRRPVEMEALARAHAEGGGGEDGAVVHTPRRRATFGVPLGLRRLLSKRTGMGVDELPPFDKTSAVERGSEGIEALADKITSITVHRTDELPHDQRIAHPLLSVHVINGFTGRPLRKSNVERPGVTAHEHLGPSDPLPHILPMMTRPCSLQGAAMRLPVWEEELVLGEELLYLLHPHVFLLFELLDFAPEAEVGEGGLQQFAWGFFKLISGPMAEPGRANALRQMPIRLQLYRWQTRLRSPPTQPAVWSQYLAAGRQTYSSTLYVTLRAIPPPGWLTVKFPYRPMAAHHREEGRMDFEALVEATTEVEGGEGMLVGVGSSGLGRPLSTSRGSGPCLVPNTFRHALEGGSMGATVIAFSPDGKLIACALAQADISLLVVYEVFSARKIFSVHAHHRTTHELSWEPGGERLLSVSADSTAKVWQPVPLEEEEEESGEPLLVLPHPSFVFCGRFQPQARLAGGRARDASLPSLLVTGGGDHAVRLWDGASGELLATRFSHASRVNSLAWSFDGSQLFSCDASGKLRLWEVVARLGSSAGADLKMCAAIDQPELNDVSINSIATHPTRRRLLVHTRDSQLLSLETRLKHFSARYTGHRCGAYNVRASYSPDGRFVTCGSEAGLLYVWEEGSGSLLFEGWDVGLRGPLLQVAWSQTDHILAVCSYAERAPILLYYHDPSSAPAESDGGGSSSRSKAEPPKEREGRQREGEGRAKEGAILPADESTRARADAAMRRERRASRQLRDVDMPFNTTRASKMETAIIDAEMVSARRKAAAAARRALSLGDVQSPHKEGTIAQ